jgi:hypothetical protein
LSPVWLEPGKYYLVQQASGGENGILLPVPDDIGSVNMATTAGKVALTNSTSALFGACPNSDNVVDLVGYGSGASCFRGSGPAPSGSNTLAVTRKSNGCTDTQNNANDFVASSPLPRNISFFAAPCPSPGTVLLWAELKRVLVSDDSSWRVLFRRANRMRSPHYTSEWT